MWISCEARFVIFANFVIVSLVMCPFCLVIIDTPTYKQCVVAINISVFHSLISCLLFRCPEIGDTVIKDLFWISKHNRMNKCLKYILKCASFEGVQEISSPFLWYKLRRTRGIYVPFIKYRPVCGIGWSSSKDKLLLLLKPFALGFCHPGCPRKTTEWRLLRCWLTETGCSCFLLVWQRLCFFFLVCGIWGLGTPFSAWLAHHQLRRDPNVDVPLPRKAGAMGSLVAEATCLPFPKALGLPDCLPLSLCGAELAGAWSGPARAGENQTNERESK